MHETSVLTVGVSAVRTTAVASDRKAANKSSDSFVSCMVDFTYSWIVLNVSERMWHCSVYAVSCNNCFVCGVINPKIMQLSRSFEKWQLWKSNNLFRQHGTSQAHPETYIVQKLCCQCVNTRSMAKHPVHREQRYSLNMQVEQVRPLLWQQSLENHCCACKCCSTCLKCKSNRLSLQVPDAEFFAVEQALLAAGRQLAAKPRQFTGPAGTVRKLPASITSNRKPSAMQQTGPTADGKKRKLPPSLSQQHNTKKVQAGLQYKVHVNPSMLSVLCIMFTRTTSL